MPSPSCRPTVALCAVISALALLAAPAGAAPVERVYYDGLDRDGQLTGGVILLERPLIDRSLPPTDARSVTIIDNGPTANRIDLVCVGDGYLEGELGLYASHVTESLAGFFAQVPFSTYATLFNVHRVDVVSNESGVDNDPVPGIDRDTALDMAFWCGGIERLLCVDVGKAYAHALNAPDLDQVFASANSTMYGGAGYTDSELATFAGGNEAAIELALHELGHSLGNLADEYHYGDGAAYVGPEPTERNVSTYNAVVMDLLGAKWANWLGDPGSGHGGPVDTFEGAYYHQYGVHRPTANSKMRALGQPFNLPCVEGLILEFYRIVDPVDAHLPNDVVLVGNELAWVDPIDPTHHALAVQWFLDDMPLNDATADTLDLASIMIEPGAHTLSVVVVDGTELVRDEAARAELMTRTITWLLDVPTPTQVAAGDVTPGSSLALQHVPNPFNPRTTVHFTVPHATSVELRVHDVTGRVVRTLVDGVEFGPGMHAVGWDGRDDRGRAVASGTYLSRLRAGDLLTSGRMTLVR